jgi:hypothetical protein
MYVDHTTGEPIFVKTIAHSGQLYLIYAYGI